MTRRITAIAAVAAALALAPAAAASAYEAEEYVSSVSASTAGTGDAVAYVVNGPVFNTSITVNVVSVPETIPSSAISIAGAASLTKATDANGAASFSITLAEEGVYSFTAVDSQGDLIDSQTITVGALAEVPGAAAPGTPGTAAPGTAAPGAAGAPGTATGNRALAVTGSSAAPLAMGAGVLAAAGVGAVLLANRRREGSRA
ncbi:hypothetical protein [Sanguibacter suaedae]|uniref:Gram-positive cocci surface proteins LPxTG domain-containing protein n=1 Tax=Sanguibacter suaedae TaxID=2795737 RepID=A0A934I9Y3_9MICO|nr:hypothetical protein [Sanguibacter suaedae]MBI9114607.1 hypothetical protein [Sanguibacter suaedae]